MKEGCVWSDDDVITLRQKYLEGLTDREISYLLQRSAGAVEAKRTQLRLIAKLHPHRQAKPQRFVGRSYTQVDDLDILTRYNNGEHPESIAISYDVSERALLAKVERLLDSNKRFLAPKIGRRCLWCGTWFTSREPKRIRRRCDTCRQNEMSDTSFLTVY